MAIQKNLLVDQGSDFSDTNVLKNNDGSPKDLSLYVAKSQMRRNHYSPDYTEMSTVITVPAEGILTISLTAKQTYCLKPGRYVYDIDLIESSSSATITTRVVEGIVTVTPSATR